MIKFILPILVIINFQCIAQVVDDNYIKELSKQYKYKNIVAVIPVLDEQQKIIIKWDQIIDYYNNNTPNSNDKNIYSFLKSLYDNKLSCDLKKIGPYFMVNKDAEIFKDYRQKGFKFIANRYAYSSMGTIFPKKLNKDNLYGMIQIMFENGYFVYFAGYSGTYSFRRSGSF